MPYHTGVLEDAPTDPRMIFMPDRSAGRQERGADTEPGAALFPPAGNVIEGDPVGSVSEADADAAGGASATD